MRVLLYTDPAGRGGAEISLGNLAAAVDAAVDVHVVGRHRDLTRWIADRRPDTPAHVVGTRPTSHLELFRRVRPDVVHVNRSVPWTCATGLAAALVAGGWSSSSTSFHCAPPACGCCCALGLGSCPAAPMRTSRAPAAPAGRRTSTPSAADRCSTS
jgi:hypothetical protein